MSSREFKLLRDCCRWSFGGGSQEGIAAACARVDWSRLLQLARRHRVEALAWDCLARLDCEVPSAIAAAFAADAADTTARNLASAAECGALLGAFEAAQIPLLFLKGLSLAAIAYPRPLIKMSWDIDVLVEPRRLGEAAELLQAKGWMVRVPRDRAVSEWHGRRKESVWENPGHGLFLELHTRLADNQRLIPTIGVQSPVQHVEIVPGIVLPTLREEHLFAYLCVHGASSNWFRLKWITDLAALLHGKGPDAIERSWKCSQELGAGRAASQALLLADAVYGPLLDDRFAGRLRSDPWARWLARSAFRELGAVREPADRLLGTARIHLTQFALLPGLRFKTTEFTRQLSDAFS